MAHDTIQRAYELIDQANDTLDRAAIASAERYGKPDALEVWQASMPTQERPTTKKGNRVSKSDMIAALVKHEVAKSLREHGTVTRSEMRRALEDFAEMIGAETGKAERVLREEIAELRNELRGHGTVTPMRGRDADAA